MSKKQRPEVATRSTWTVPETAKIAGVSRDVIMGMIDAGDLPFLQTGSTRVVVPRWAVEAWVGGASLPIGRAPTDPVPQRRKPQRQLRVPKAAA